MSEKWTCRICKYRSKSQVQADLHHMRHEEDPNYYVFKCDQCDFSCSNSKTHIRRRHIEKHKEDDNLVRTESGELSCRLCSTTSETLKNRNEAGLHLREFHGVQLGLRLFTCSQCSKHFNSQESFRAHTALVHEGRKPFACEQCGASYRTGHYLRKHTAAAHSELEREPVICDICGKRLTTMGSLWSHKKYSCRATEEGAPNQHQDKAKHPVSKCSQCGFSGRNSTEVKKHVLKEHPELYTFQCSSCPNKYMRQQDLLKHEKKHVPSSSSWNTH